MKKGLFTRIFAILVVSVMLITSCMSISAVSVSAPGNVADENENYYTVSFENGVLTVRLNPDKIHALIKDGDLTKEELTNFIPADVLETLSKGKELTSEDLTELASHYITVDDLKELIDYLPTEVLSKYFSLDMLAEIITVDEILSIIPIDDILNSVSDEDIKGLINDEAVKLMLTDKVKEKVLTEGLMDYLVNETPLVDDIINTKLDALLELVTPNIIAAILEDHQASLEALVSDKATVLEMIKKDEVKEILENYLVADRNVVNDFLDDPKVDAALLGMPSLKQYLLDHKTDIISALVQKDVFTKENITDIFPKKALEELVTEDVITALLGNNAVVDNLFADDTLVNKVLTSDIIEYMVIEKGLDPNATNDDIKALIRVPANTDLREKLAESAKSNLTFDECWSIVDIEILAAEVDDATISKVLHDHPEAYDNIFKDNNVHPHDIVTAIGTAECEHIIHDHADELINAVGMELILSHYELDGIVEALGGYISIVKNQYIPLGTIANACGGYINLIGYFDYNDLFELVGVDKLTEYIDIKKDIIDPLGGYSGMISMYESNELKAILDAIGKENIEAFIKDSGIAEKIDIKQIATDLIDLLKSKKTEIKELIKTLGKNALSFLLTDVKGIYLNGAQIFKAGSFDLDKIIKETLRAIPNVDSFLKLPPDAIFAEYIFTAEIGDDEYDFGVKLGLLGDPAKLQNTIKRLADNYRLDVYDDGSIDLMVVAPEVMSDLYARILESDRVPSRLKGKLIDLPTMNIEDARDFLAGITDEQLQTLIDAVKDKLDEIKDKAYEKIDAVKKNEPALLADDAEEEQTDYIESAKAAVDRIIEKFATVEKARTLLDKAVSVIDAIPETLSNAQIMDFYNGDGNFTADGSAEVDLLALINKYITLPDKANLLFTSTTLSYNVDADITVNGLRKVNLVLADGSIYTTMLPAGVSLKVLENVEALGDISSGFSSWDALEIGNMPEGDVTLYSNDLYQATFMANGVKVATVFYVNGADSIEEPAIPTGNDRVGYSVEWEDYTLGISPRMTVNLKYTPIRYTATFKVGDDTVFTRYFTVEDETIPNMPEVPAKPGYSGKWSEYEIIADNITITAEYALNTYTIDFVADGKVIASDTFTAEDMDITVPTVPEKAGYRGVWEAYTLIFENLTVDAVYTPIQYTASFAVDGKVIATDTFTVEDLVLDVPEVPAKIGYIGEWEKYTIVASDITVNAVYTPIKYTATFMADGKEVGRVQFTIEDKTLSAPEVPTKVGYTGAWESYSLEAKDITVNAVYTANVYTATFMADGKEVGKVQFTVEDKSIAEPAVPAKKGFTGEWEDYTLEAKDITVNAIYTPEEGGMSFWWWILIIIAIIVIAVVIFFIFKMRTPPADPEPEPEPVVEPEPEPEPEPVIIAPVIEEVDDVAADEVDDLMSDDDALAGVVIKESETPSEGQRAIINIGAINDNFNDGDTVNLEILQEKKLVPAKAGRLKVLADGHLNKHHLTVEANSFSVQAIKMIQLTGGTTVQKK